MVSDPQEIPAPAQTATRVHDSAPPPSSARAAEFRTAGRNAIKLLVSLVLTWTVGMFVKFIPARALGAEHFGELNLADSTSCTFFAFIDLGMTTYMLREIPVRPKHASEFWGGLLVVRIVISTLLYLAMAESLRIGTQGTQASREIQIAGAIFCLAYFAQTYSTSVGGLLQAMTQVDRLAISNVLSKVLFGVATGVALVAMRYLPGAALSLFALPLLISEVAKIAILHPEASRAVGLDFRFDAAATKRALLESLPFFISNSAINLGGTLNAMVLGFVIPNKAELGYFKAAQNLASLTMFLSPLLQWVLMPLLAKAKTRSTDEVYEIVRRTNEGLVLLVTPITLLASLGAQLWVRLAYKSGYESAAVVLQVWSLGFILIYLAMTLSTLLVMTGHSWSVSAISLGSLPVRPLLVLVLAPVFARHFGLGGAALGGAVSDVITTVGIVIVHFIPLGWKAIDRRFVTTFVKTVLVAAGVIVFDHYVRGKLGQVVLILDLVVYAALAVLLGAVRISDMKRLVREVIARRGNRNAQA
jgi:O-antigen/teichoic acid export membrane protein